MKKIICMLLVFMFCTKSVYASEMPVMIYVTEEEQIEILDDSIDTYFLPVAIPAGQAIVYLMGTLGVVGVGSAIFANADTIQAWGEEQIQKFKVKCLALGLTVELVDNWLDDLSSGVLKKSSEVWTAFKTWVSDLRMGVGTGTITTNGLVKGGTSVNAFDYLADINNSYIAWKAFTINAVDDGYLFVARNPRYDAKPSEKSWALIYATTNYEDPGSISGIRTNDELAEWKIGISSTSKNVVVNGITYYYHSILELGSSSIDYCTVAGLPGVKTDYAYNVLKGLLGVTVESDYTIVGGITDINGVNVSNPWDTTSNDVVINWDNVGSLGGVAGVIGGVADGSITWDDALTSGGIIVEENDVTIGGSETVNPPIEVPEIDWSWWSWLKDWIMSFFDALGNLLKSLFIPDTGFFSNNFNKLKDLFSTKFGFDNYTSFFEQLKNQVASKPDYQGFINTDIWLPYIDKIHYYIKGFIYALMVIFNIKMLIWLVRGSTPIVDGKGNVIGGRSS